MLTFKLMSTSSPSSLKNYINIGVWRNKYDLGGGQIMSADVCVSDFSDARRPYTCPFVLTSRIYIDNSYYPSCEQEIVDPCDWQSASVKWKSHGMCRLCIMDKFLRTEQTTATPSVQFCRRAVIFNLVTPTFVPLWKVCEIWRYHTISMQLFLR